MTPTLRTDRDTILVGTLADKEAQDVTIQAEVNGEKIEMAWHVTPEATNLDFSFLPKLVETARGDEGLTSHAELLSFGGQKSRA